MGKPNLNVCTDPWPQVRAASYIAGAGMAVPPNVVPNAHFASYLETSDDWIRERTGIEQRRWADTHVSASELAEPAARQAIERSGLALEEIDAVIVATVTPDYVFPSTACILQQKLGLRQGFAFDLNAVCSGFVYALTVGNSLIASGQCRNALIVGVDIYSHIIDRRDRGTCILFGDGAGAIVLSSARSTAGTAVYQEGSAGSLRGLYAAQLGSDGSGALMLYTPNGTAARPTPQSLEAGEHYLRMDGREVFKVAVRRLAELSESLLKEVGVTAEQVDYFITHQANKRIILSMAKHLGVDDRKVLMNIGTYGNTSAASIPVLLAESEAAGIIKKGDLLLITAFGGGFTWGGAVVRW